MSMVYALAAFRIAVRHQQIEQWQSALHQACLSIQHRTWRQWLAHPHISVDQKVDQWCKILGSVSDSNLRHYLKILLTDRVSSQLPYIYRCFVEQVSDFYQEQTVHVWSAYDVTDEMLAYVIDWTEHRFQKKAKIQVHMLSDQKDDAKIGLFVRAGDWVLDMLMQNQLHQSMLTLSQHQN